MCQHGNSGSTLQWFFRLAEVRIANIRRSHPSGWLLHYGLLHIIGGYKMALIIKGSAPLWEMIPQGLQAS